MRNNFIVPVNLSKLGFRYFRIMLESKLFSKRFIEYLINHPNTGYVFEGQGWSGKKRVLGIGIWATSNAEISDIATHIRSRIPESYEVVYQSELTRLEYLRITEQGHLSMTLLDELEQKQDISALELDFLKLLSVDASIAASEMATLLGVSETELSEISDRLIREGVYYGVFENTPLPIGYTKFFVNTAALTISKVEHFYGLLKNDPNCVYLARGNGKYNIEFEYVLEDEPEFQAIYSSFLKHAKRIQFDKNIFTNLFPQSKFLNVKAVQDAFVELAKTSDTTFDLRNSKLWYVSHEGARAYLDIYSNERYGEVMKSGEVTLFKEIAEEVRNSTGVFNIIDLGSGDGLKARALIETLGEDRIKSYFPVDIQELELAQALRAHEGAQYAIHPTVLGFEKLGVRFPIATGTNERNLFVLFGGTYGNFPTKQINTYLMDALGDQDKLVISMPISDFSSKENIKRSYQNKIIENVSFGPLQQIGFRQEDFLRNPDDPTLFVQPVWVDNILVQTFILARSKHLLGVYLEAGTQFQTVSSWKPTLREFREALEKNFVVDQMFSNRQFVIAVCAKKG